MVTTDHPLEVKAVANLFLDWADDLGVSISPLKLQKLLFFCHADFILFLGKPLVKQGFEAWDYGPVNPSVYREFKKFGDQPIRDRAKAFDPITARSYVPTCFLSQDDEAELRKKFAFYNQFSAIALSELSHSRAGPWRQARSLFSNGLNADRAISTEMIREYHRLFNV